MTDLDKRIKTIVEAVVNYYGSSYKSDDDYQRMNITEAHAAIKALITEAKEVFVPVRGYEGLYEVSNTGKVRSLPRSTTRGGILVPGTRFGEYQCVCLSNGSSKQYNIHRLVAEAFLSNPQKKPTVNHKDGNPKNNNVDNLEWATYSENNAHGFKRGRVIWNKGISTQTLKDPEADNE